ncbi:MAG: peptidoglycan-binding domain-containing protein [Candidatus Staskawiczbacteria bacterium]|nr:peptidoglycan-binding domain-containing protein [Candidatus Staskawiczbacteria bacterium]
MKIKFLVFVAVFVVVVLCFGVAEAQTIDTTTLIAQLQAQIAQLTAQINTMLAQKGANTNQAICNNLININLGFVQSGNDAVGMLHKILSSENISFGLDSGNTYSNDTANAVKKLQAKYGILQTGYVGPQTRVKLKELYKKLFNCIAPTESTSQSNIVQNQTQQDQAQNQVTTQTSQTITQTPTPASTAGSSPITHSYNLNCFQNCPAGTVPGSSLAVTCSGTQDPINNTKINWVATVTGGSGNYTYQWRGVGNEPYRSSNRSFSVDYLTPGLKTIELIVTDGPLITLDDLCQTTIKSLTPESVITALTSPKDGDTWIQGHTYQIAWQGVNLNDGVYLWLEDYNGKQYSISDLMYPGAIKGNSFSWTVPFSVQTGKYFLLVNAVGGNTATKAINVSSGTAGCTPNWSCQYGLCTNGYRTGLPVDSNSCNTLPTASTANCQPLQCI